jgi:hypothetical protein
MFVALISKPMLLSAGMSMQQAVQHYGFQKLMDGIACYSNDVVAKKLTEIDYDWAPAAVYACQYQVACRAALQSIQPSAVSLEVYEAHQAQVRRLERHMHRYILRTSQHTAEL